MVVPPDTGVSLSPVFTTFPSPTCAAVTPCGFDVSVRWESYPPLSVAVMPLFIAAHWAAVNELLFRVYSYTHAVPLYLNRRYSSMTVSPVSGSTLSIETRT